MCYFNILILKIVLFLITHHLHEILSIFHTLEPFFSDYKGLSNHLFLPVIRDHTQRMSPGNLGDVSHKLCTLNGFLRGTITCKDGFILEDRECMKRRSPQFMNIDTK